MRLDGLVRSQNFEHFLTRGEISHLSNADELFKGNDHKIRTKEVVASAWLDNLDRASLLLQ